MTRRKMPPSELKHGRRSTYTYHRCHCAECRAANAEYIRNKVTNNRESAKAQANAGNRSDDYESISTIRHGLRVSYEYYGCKCEKCREAVRERWTLRKGYRIPIDLNIRLSDDQLEKLLREA